MQKINTIAETLNSNSFVQESRVGSCHGEETQSYTSGRLCLALKAQDQASV
jgi:hypothetical protein